MILVPFFFSHRALSIDIGRDGIGLKVTEIVQTHIARLIKSVSAANGKKVLGDSQVVQGTARPIWQVKQRRFDPSAKILIFKKILLQTMKQKIFAPFFVKEFF